MLRQNYQRKIGVIIGVISASIILGTAGLNLRNVVLAESGDKIGLSVSPQKLELDVFPGEKIEKVIRVRNTGQLALPLLARTADFSAEEGTGEMTFDENSENGALFSRTWFSFNEPNFILEPGEEKEVKFSINVPQEAEHGGSYSVVLFEPQLPSFYFKEGQSRSIPVVGVLFLLSVKKFALEPTSEINLQVVEFYIPEKDRMLAVERIIAPWLASVVETVKTKMSVVEKMPAEFMLKIKNRDAFHIRPSGKLVIYDFLGRKAGEGNISPQTILPGKIRDFQVNFSPDVSEKLKWLPSSVSDFLLQGFFTGKYRATLILKAKSSVGDEFVDVEIPSVLTFFAIPWKFWTLFVISASLAIFLALKYGNRLKIAVKVLFKR